MLPEKRSRDEHTLALPLRALAEGLVGESSAADASEHRHRRAALGVVEPSPPRREQALFSGKNDLERRRRGRQALGDAVPDRADPLTQHP